MKKKFRFPAVLITCIILFGSTYNIQVFASSPVSYSFHTKSAWLQSDIIEWRYKVVDGKLYRRQYNCTKDKWIGKWELVE